MYKLKNFKVPKIPWEKCNIYSIVVVGSSNIIRLVSTNFIQMESVLLRLFGASVGKNVIIRPTAKITYPWKVNIGDYSWIGDDVTLYSLGNIIIGNNSIISQRCYLCAGSHDYNSVNFDITSEDIIIGDSCWLATDVLFLEGIIIGSNCVVGARSSVFKKFTVQ